MGGKPRAAPRRGQDPALADTVMMETTSRSRRPAAADKDRARPTRDAGRPSFFGQRVGSATPSPPPVPNASGDRTIELSLADLEPLDVDDETA